MKALNFNETQTAVALFLKADVVPFIFGHQDALMKGRMRMEK